MAASQKPGTIEPRETANDRGGALPFMAHKRINYDLLYKYVAGRYPRLLKRLAE